MDKFKTYLTDQKIKHHEFAELIGTTQATVTRYVNGDRRPSVSTALKIEKVTKGKVKVSDWYRDIVSVSSRRAERRAESAA